MQRQHIILFNLYLVNKIIVVCSIQIQKSKGYKIQLRSHARWLSVWMMATHVHLIFLFVCDKFYFLLSNFMFFFLSGLIFFKAPFSPDFDSFFKFLSFSILFIFFANLFNFSPLKKKVVIFFIFPAWYSKKIETFSFSYCIFVRLNSKWTIFFILISSHRSFKRLFLKLHPIVYHHQNRLSSNWVLLYLGSTINWLKSKNYQKIFNKNTLHIRWGHKSMLLDFDSGFVLFFHFCHLHSSLFTLSTQYK